MTQLITDLNRFYRMVINVKHLTNEEFDELIGFHGKALAHLLYNIQPDHREEVLDALHKAILEGVESMVKEIGE